MGCLGSSQAWSQVSPGHTMSCTLTQPTTTFLDSSGHTCQFLGIPPRGQRSLFILWSPAYPPKGFSILQGLRSALVYLFILNKPLHSDPD